jgi:hypothetical protein
MGGAPKMRYCLWKSIGNHHIPTTDSYFLNLYLINDEVQLCKKNVGAPYYDSSCLQYRTILINRVVISSIENKVSQGTPGWISSTTAVGTSEVGRTYTWDDIKVFDTGK